MHDLDTLIDGRPSGPVFPLRTPLMQALLATHYTPDVAAMATHAGAFLVDAGPDDHDLYAGPIVRGSAIESTLNPARHVRLLAYYTPAEKRGNGVEGGAQGLVILLHGWEGSSHGMINMGMGAALVNAGYDLVRLNLRDHGLPVRVDPVYLNEGLFLGTLLAESRRAVVNLATLAQGKPVFLIGPSMGGNFVLRMATSAAGPPIPGLAHVIAINPAINPGRSTDLLDTNYAFRHYFRSRWLRTLRRKAAAFPDHYDFGPVVRLDLVRPMTEWLVRRYTRFESADAYFAAYAFLGQASLDLAVPTTILTAADDPVIPAQDIEELADSPLLARHILPWGGHVGYIAGPPMRHLLPEHVLAILSAAR